MWLIPCATRISRIVKISNDQNLGKKSRKSRLGRGFMVIKSQSILEKINHTHTYLGVTIENKLKSYS